MAEQLGGELPEQPSRWSKWKNPFGKRSQPESESTPKTLEDMQAEIEKVRAERGEANEQLLAKEKYERVQNPENIKSLRKIEEVIDLIDLDWGTACRKEIEERYGEGNWSKFKAFLAGEYDVSTSRVASSEQPKGRKEKFTRFIREYGTEAARRILRTSLNKKVIGSAIAWHVVNTLTAGAGSIAGATLWWGMGGRGTGELWTTVKGKEREAREELLVAQYDKFIRMKELKREYNAARKANDIPEKERLAKEILDLHGEASVEVLRKRKYLDEVVKSYNALCNKAQLAGTVAGFGYGIHHAAELLAENTAEAGQEAFGGVDVDFDHTLHSVYQEGDHLNSLYNSAAERLQEETHAHLINAKLTVVEKGAHGAHALLDPHATAEQINNAKHIIWGEAMAKGLLVGLGGMSAELLPMSMAPDADRELEHQKDLEADKKRISEHLAKGQTLEYAKYRPVEEVMVGDTLDLSNVALKTFRDVGGQDNPWNSAWLIARVEGVEETANGQLSIQVVFGKDESNLQTQYSISLETWNVIRQAAFRYFPTPEEHQELERVDFKAFFEGNTGKWLKLHGRVTPDNLRIGYSLTNSQNVELNADTRYKLDSVNYGENRAVLISDEGSRISVNLIKLHSVTEKFLEDDSKVEEVKSKTEATPKTTTKPETKEAPMTWAEAQKYLQARGDAAPTSGQLWVLEGADMLGKDQNDKSVPVATGTYRHVRIIGTDMEFLPNNGLGSPIRIALRDVVLPSMSTEARKVKALFKAQEKDGKEPPNNYQIARDQQYEVSPTAGGVSERYVVTSVDAGDGTVKLTSIARPHDSPVTVTRLYLAQHGEYKR